ncbi:glycosyltransferase [Desulfobacula phenolica]|uniref:Glycosyl transferase family 2 n=1 Tax=Desulfobacula phenolica TaxID=90732 RepID=A0A1H2DY09_9BACT|nr:glycosyltransferase [Desulfobacula phenolica]SDT87669.1 Glycosyl transferase family 2 [Desulfobacula phenolica]
MGHSHTMIPEEGARPCRTISVVIPALNEEAFIGSCVKIALRSPHVIEAIVVDGGSVDHTLSKARSAGARTFLHNLPYGAGGGRGGQIRVGIMKARGDVVAIVHADTRVPLPVFGSILRILNAEKRAIGGAVGSRFSTASSSCATRIRCRIIEYLNHVRVLFTGISFGDQVQFFRRGPVVRLDLFPAIALMEDVEFSIRLRSLGRLVYLNKRAEVSARRWEKKGSANAFLIIRLFFHYLVKRLGKNPDSGFFFESYYGKPPQN